MKRRISSKKAAFLLGIGLLVILCTLNGALAVAETAPTAYWKLNETSGTTAYEYSGTWDGTHINTPTHTAACILDYCLDFDKASTERVNTGLTFDDLGSSWTYTAWFKTSYDFSGDFGLVFGSTDEQGSYDPFVQTGFYAGRGSTSNRFTVGIRGDAAGGVEGKQSSADMNDGAWHFVAIQYHDSNVDLYIDGVNETTVIVGNSPIGGVVDGNDVIPISGYWERTTYAGGEFDGLIDDVRFYNSLLNQTELLQIYNNGTGCEYGSCGVTPPSYPYHSVHITDLYDDSDLEDVNITIDGEWNLTDASGVATVWNHSGDSKVWTSWKTGYFGDSGTVNENSTANGTFYEANYTVTITEVVTNNTVEPYNITTDPAKVYLNGSGVYLTAGVNNLTFTKIGGGYYDADFTIDANSTPETSGNYSSQQAYNLILNITAENAFTNASITNFSVTVNESTNGYSETFSTTTGILSLHLLQNLTYDLFINASESGYAPANHSLTPNSTEENYTFDLWSQNTIRIYIRDADTGDTITANISVTVSGNITEETYSTTTGFLYIENLTDGQYTIKLQGTNYSLSTYIVTVADQSSQVLNAYLSLTTEETIFTVQDFDSGATLEGASMTMERLVNSSWTVIESKLTDITGRAQFSYKIGVKYRFTVTLLNYETKQFTLDPIIFDSYTVRLEKETTLEEDVDYTAVSTTHSPKAYYEDQNETFTLLFQSPGGVLQTYGYTFAYPGGSSSGSGNNSIGETFTHAFTISGASIGDYANLTYWYDTTLGDNRSFTYRYLVSGVIQNQSHLDVRNQDYGLGDFEKGLIGTGVTVLIAGLGTLVGGALTGGSLGLLGLGYFTYIGFFGIWHVLISFLVGLILIAMRSSR